MNDHPGTVEPECAHSSEDPRIANSFAYIQFRTEESILLNFAHYFGIFSIPKIWLTIPQLENRD